MRLMVQILMLQPVGDDGMTVGNDAVGGDGMTVGAADADNDGEL